MNEPSPTGQAGVTRKQELLQTWVQVKRIDSLSSTEKIDHLTSQPSESLKLSIDDFEDRGAMLQDVRARISYLKRDLGALLTSLPTVTRNLEHECCSVKKRNPKRNRPAATPRSTLDTTTRVISSCCGAVPANLVAASKMHSRSCCADEHPAPANGVDQTVLSPFFVIQIHGFADAVGESYEDITGDAAAPNLARNGRSPEGQSPFRRVPGG